MSFVLDLTRGQARVRQVVFNRGQPRPTVSIGRAAAWSLVAEDLEDVHAFVSFDGAALMVRSAEEHNPAWLDGRAVPCAWTPVGRASILALGNARITVTAKEDHVRPGHDDDDEVTGQMELRPAPPRAGGANGANGPGTPSIATGPTGVTAITGPPSTTDPDGVDTGDAVTGDEPTGEMTGARAPARGLLPKPRVPPRPSAPMMAAPVASMVATPPPAPLAVMEVPDFDDATQLRPRDHLVPAAGRPAPPRPVRPLDDDERTHALDVQAMQAAQRAAASAPPAAPAPRPARPNISIAPDIDEATRMLSLGKPAHPAALLATVPAPPPAAVLAAPMFPAPFAPALVDVLAPVASSAPLVDEGERDTPPPPSGATHLRPMTAQPFRPPNQLVPVRPRAETLIDPFAKTGGGPTAVRNLPPIPVAGSADITGPSRIAGAGAAAPPKKPRSAASTWIAAALTLTALGGYGYYLFLWHPRPAPFIPSVSGVATTATAQPGVNMVPVVAATDTDAAAGATIPQNRTALPLPEFPHKGAVDAGPALDAGFLDAGLATVQRAASDAVADGDYGRAILYYDQLAALDPSTGAYSAAARILRAQMAADAGGRHF